MEDKVPEPGNSAGDRHDTDTHPAGPEYDSDLTTEPVSAETGSQPAAEDDDTEIYPESFDGPAVAVDELPAAVEEPPAAVEEPPAAVEPARVTVEPAPQPQTGGGGGTPPGASGGGGDGGGDGDGDDGMVKMSFLEHLEELRKRLIHSLIAVGVSFFVCFAFASRIFDRLTEPVRGVLRELKMAETVYYNRPTDSFTILLNISLVISLFIASPIVLYQVWAFISPGLYKKERNYAVPFVFFCSGLFMAGGAFGYFIAFPYALKFLLTFGGAHMTPWITASEYMDMFWTVILGLGIIFELPVLMMFLGLLGIVTPGFLLRHIRYAVLLIFILAAIVTPTPDVMNMMIFAIPMLGLFMLGVGLVWAVQRKRKTRWSWR